MHLASAVNKRHNRRMNCGDSLYIWQSPDWPHWRYDWATLAEPLAVVSRAQGELFGRLTQVGLRLRDQANLNALTEEVVTSHAIEGESLPVASVRSSLARRLGVDIGALAPTDRSAEGVVEMILDATGRYSEPVTAGRLFGWHAALFPTGYSGLSPLRVGQWREDTEGPMQVVSGPIGRQRIHFEAPPAAQLGREMERFFTWLNAPPSEPLLIRAGIGHLWFVTLHPFEDGNGRIARAIGDLLLARAEGSTQRFYSLSAQIQQERSAYYTMLEQTQKGTLDITAWLRWFLGMLEHSIRQAHTTLDRVFRRAQFWNQWAALPFNPRQIKVLNRLLEGFEGNMTSRRWAAIAHCSTDSALRDIQALLDHGVLQKAAGGGRSSSYELKEFPQKRGA